MSVSEPINSPESRSLSRSLRVDTRSRWFAYLPQWAWTLAGDLTITDNADAVQITVSTQGKSMAAVAEEIKAGFTDASEVRIQYVNLFGLFIEVFGEEGVPDLASGDPAKDLLGTAQGLAPNPEAGNPASGTVQAHTITVSIPEHEALSIQSVQGEFYVRPETPDELPLPGVAPFFGSAISDQNNHAYPDGGLFTQEEPLGEEHLPRTVLFPPGSVAFIDIKVTQTSRWIKALGEANVGAFITAGGFDPNNPQFPTV